MRRSLPAAVLLLLLVPPPLPATAADRGEPGAGLVVLPRPESDAAAPLTLDGPHARQTLRVVRAAADSGGDFVAIEDLTESARFEVADPGVARVAPGNVLLPVEDGETEVIARVENGGDPARTETATLKVRVANRREPRPRGFLDDVIPILTKAGCNMGACHGSAAGKNGFRLTLRGYGPEIDHLTITRQADGRRIHATEPGRSLLLLKGTGVVGHGGGARVAPDSEEYRVLAEWIAEGAPGPRSDEAPPVELVVDPPAARLAPGDRLGYVVRAKRADGSIRDVTHLAKFGVADESVAEVDEETGRTVVRGSGETAATVWYSGLVARVVLSSPYQPPLPPETIADAPRRNRIDDFNLRRLAALNIPPAPPCDDATFIRRASLDATGALPSPDEVRDFLRDPDPDKRAKLVERLLASPEHVDYWTYKWSDLFLVSSRKLPAPAVAAFHRFLRESVRENASWDAIARRVLAARGSTLENGAGNYFVLHRDPVDLTETTSQAFLGLSMTCARCHNHPLEKWTQDQYYGLANMFARVKLKDGDAPGDVFVTSAPPGEGGVPHPRSGRIPPPRALDAPALDPEDPRDPRDAFVDWLVRPDNPLFARAVVNRVWANYFGRGLVDPEDDLRATNPPVDEPLLDWLADDFRANGYDLRRLQRLILNSAVYARSAEPAPGDRSDPKLLARYPVRRLPAETILDGYARVTGAPPEFPGRPRGARAYQLNDSKVPSPFLDAFGRPERLVTCSCERSSEPSLAQALHLANGDTLNDMLRAERGAVSDALGKPLERWLEDLFLGALARKPRPDEIEAAREAVESAESDEERRQAVEDVFWAVLASKEFLFQR